MKKYKFFFLLFLLINFSVGYGQSNLKFPPLYKFLQNNTDSTIVLHYESNWVIPPKYVILCKKRDTISTFTYSVADNTDKRAVIPYNFRYKLYEVSMLKFDKSPVAFNEFFHVKYICPDSLQHLWKEVVSLKPWSIKDDKIDGFGCPINQSGFQGSIHDGSTYILDLITKNNILNLKFYAPYYFEIEVCPGKDGRKRILQIDKLFRSYFGDY